MNKNIQYDLKMVEFRKQNVGVKYHFPYLNMLIIESIVKWNMRKMFVKGILFPGVYTYHVIVPGISAN